MFNAMSTIEFYEKWSIVSNTDNVSIYDRGVYGNIKAVLGDNELLWLLPCSPPSGTGLEFRFEDTSLMRDLESGRGIRQKHYGLLGQTRGVTTSQQEKKQRRHSSKKRAAAGTGAAPDSEVSSINGSERNLDHHTLQQEKSECRPWPLVN